MNVVAVGLFFLSSALPAAQEKRPELSLETRLLARVPKDHGADGIAFSPDGRKVAYRAKLMEDPEAAVYVGEKKQPLLRPGDPVWSPDSARLACPAADGEKYCMTVDGKKLGDSYEGVDHPVFSPDGAKLAYRALRDGKFFMIVGGAKGEDFDEIGPASWSPDSKRMMYYARRGDDSFVVLDGKKIGPYLGVVPMGDVNVFGGPTFSPDGRPAYVAARLVDEKVVYGAYLDGALRHEARDESKEPYEGAMGPTFGPAGGEVVWVAGSGVEMFIFLGGRKVDPKHPLASLPAVSGEGKFAFKSQRSDGDQMKSFVVADGKPGPEFGFMFPDPPIWSPDGKRVAYAGGAPTVSPFVVVLGEKRSAEFTEVYLGGFSPDGRKFAFGALRGFELWWIVME
jgi:hypothetical protein